MGVELYPEQADAVSKMHNGCVLNGDVGSGKSITSLVYFFTRVCGGSIRLNSQGTYEPPKTPKDLYIITTVKKRSDKEWEGECANLALSTDRDNSIGGIRVTIDSWNNIKKYVDVSNAFFILDEQRLTGSGVWVKSFLKIAKSNQWVMLSGTPGDSWIEYAPIFIANGFYKNRTEFITRHVVYKRFSKYPKIERYVDTKVLYKLRKLIIVAMPMERHTVRHTVEVGVDFNRELQDKIVKKRWNVFEDRPLRDAGEMFIVLRRVVNSDISRLGAVMQVLEDCPRLIIFYNFNFELDALRTLSDILNIQVNEWNGHKHEPVPDGDRWVYLVQYTSGSEGWNCVTTDSILFYSLNYSYKILEQAMGRIDRMNTPFKDLYYYILCGDSIMDKAVMKALKSKKDFNEKDYYSDNWKA